MRQPIEEILLNQALDALKRTVPVKTKVETIDGRNLLGADTIVTFTIDNKTFEYLAEIKRTANETTQNQILMQKRRVPHLLFVTRYVNPRLAVDFVRGNVEYVDTAGNAFLHRPDLFIYIKGNKAPTLPRDITATKPFPPQALKVVFAFLCEKDLVDRTYREIAQETDVALGTVALVMKQLELLGFVINKKGNLDLINKAQLLNRWIVEYNVRLRPKLFIGRFRGEPGWWNHVQLPLNKGW